MMSILDVSLTLKQIALTIDTIIYSSITWMYSVFMSIAGARIFESKLITEFVNRMYLIVSIAMLFIVAYSFLTVIINPDNLSKNNSSPVKIVKNIVISLVIIILVPAAFSFGFAVQKSVVQENVIGKLVLGNRAKTNTETFDSSAADFSVTLFETNFYVKDEATLTEDQLTDFQNVTDNARAENNIGRFGVYLDDSSEENKKMLNIIQYNYFIAGIVGIYVLYTLLIFSIDVGLRVVKLFFLEMITPFPALMMIVPGQDKIAKNWGKEVLKTYFDVFLKIAIIVFGVFLINVVNDEFKVTTGGGIVGFSSSNPSVIMFAKLFILLGIVMFMRKAPKLIEDLFGFKLSENGFSLRKRFDASGVTALAGAVGGAIAGGYASVQGARSRGKKVPVGAAASGIFHGVRLGGKAGWNGSLKGIGESHSYALANQQAWAHMDPDKGYLRNGIAVAGEMLRDNVGMKSYFDSQIAYKEIEFNKKNSSYNRSIQSLDRGAKGKIDQIEQSHKFDTHRKANDAAIKIGNDIDNKAESEVTKGSYTGYTEGYVLEKNASGGYSVGWGNIYGNNLKASEEAIDDAVKDHLIGEDDALLLRTELQSAKKRLKSDYISDSMLISQRDLLKNDSKAKSDYKSNYVADYVNNMKSTDYYKSLDATSQAALVGIWEKNASDKFDNIMNNPDDYKENVSFVNMVQSFNDAMDYTGDSAVGYDGQLSRDDNIHKTNYGVELLKALKLIKDANADIDRAKSREYRQQTIEYIDENGNKQNIILGQYQTERDRISEASKQLTEDLKNFKLAHDDEDQYAKMAQERRKYGAKHNGGNKGS